MQRLINEIFVRRKIVILLFVLLLGYGIYSYFVIPKQEMPELDTPYMVISITAPSVSASDMEVEIISDIEKAIDTFDEVTDINSTIYDNFAYILVTFSYSTVNPTEVSSDIFSRINDLALSPLISDITYTSNFDNPHIIYALHSVDLTENQLMSEANTFKNKLILLDEIKDISIDNAFQEELVILLDSSKLQLYNLTISDIYTILIANSINIPLGGLQTDEGTISVSGYPDINSIEDLEKPLPSC